MFTGGWVPFFFGWICDHWAGNMRGTGDPLTCLLLPLIVLILEVVLVLMGENRFILIKATASHLIGPTEEFLWTADPLRSLWLERSLIYSLRVHHHKLTSFTEGAQDEGTPSGKMKLNCTPFLAACFFILTPLGLQVLIKYISVLTILPTLLKSFFCKISNKQSKQAGWLIWQVGHFTTVSKGLARVQTKTQAWVALISNHSLVWVIRWIKLMGI